MVLRIEDTDAERSEERCSRSCSRTCAGSASSGTRARTSAARMARTARASAATTMRRRSRRWRRRARLSVLLHAGGTQAVAQAQLASGRPPRYAGTCAALPAEEVARRMAAGERPRCAFACRRAAVVEFDDLIHGPQRFASDDIGDFVVRRADGSVGVFPRQCRRRRRDGRSRWCCAATITSRTRRGRSCCSRRSACPLPRYGHLPLVLGADGAPLSKRDGAASLHDLREQGYLPGALRNYLVRLGHTCRADGWLETGAHGAHFDLARSSRSAAHFDEAQLRHWQREAVTHASDAVSARVAVGSARAARRHRASQRIRRGRARQPAVPGRRRATGGGGLRRERRSGRRGRPRVAAAGGEFFEQALAEWRGNAPDFKAWTRAVGAATARKGAGLYMPLRAALTGTHPRAGARAARRADGPGARGGTTGDAPQRGPRPD